MKQLFKLFMGGAIAAMVLMISACSSNDLEETVQQPVLTGDRFLSDTLCANG